MKRVPLENTNMTASDLVRLAEEEPVVLTRKGKPVVSVTEISGDDWESIALANNPKFLAIIEESRRSYREHGGLSTEEVCKELGLKVPEKNRRMPAVKANRRGNSPRRSAKRV